MKEIPAPAVISGLFRRRSGRISFIRSGEVVCSERNILRGRPTLPLTAAVQHAAQPDDRPEPLWRHLVGEQLRLRRTERGEPLRQVAQRAGVSPQYLSEVERGRKEPSSELLAAVARSLDLSLLDLTSSVAERLAGAGGREGFRLAA